MAAPSRQTTGKEPMDKTAVLGPELQAACADGNLESLKAAISQKRKEKPSYSVPWSAIMYVAASKDDTRIISYCLNEGADVTEEVVRVIWVCKSKETYTLLLDRKCVDVDYYIPWVGDILGDSATDDNIEWVELCLRYGADPNKHLCNDQHMSVLAAVAEQASLEMAKILVNAGAKVKGSGCIVMAAQEGKLDMVQFFLEKGADINEVGIAHPQDVRYEEDMGTALHRAVFEGHGDVVRFLVDHGADLNIEDPKGRKPWDVARATGNAEMIDLLKSCGASESVDR